MSPRSHNLRPVALYILALARLERHMLSNQMENLDESISHCTKAILLPPHLWLNHGPMIFRTLFLLASVLFHRSMASKLPENAIYAAKYLRYLRNQPHSSFACRRHVVTKMLMASLALQVELKSGDVLEIIEEMVTLFHEFLTSDTSDISAIGSITIFTEVVLSQISGPIQFPDQVLNEVINCLRLARMRKPELRKAHLALVRSLSCRYTRTFTDDDYEEAASILDEMIAHNSLRDVVVGDVQHFVTLLAIYRAITHLTPEYGEEAIYRARAFLCTSSVEDFVHSLVRSVLASSAEQRFHYFGSANDLEVASSQSSSGSLPVSDDNPELDKLVRILKKTELLEDLLSVIVNDNTTDIEMTIEESRSILTSFSPRDPIAPLLENFGRILFQGFERTKKIEYLNESITTYRQVLGYPIKHLRFSTLRHLFLALLTRFKDFPHRTQDFEEAIDALSQGVNDRHAGSPDRFKFACFWAFLARGFRHPSVSTAYEAAMSLMEDALLFAPTLQLQHASLVTSPDVPRSMPLDFSSCQVDLGRLEQAIETLERGRALLWSEMRYLRASVDQLRQADPDLGTKFAAVNRDLEELTKSIPPSHKLSMDDAAFDDLKAADPFGRLLLKQRKLLKERRKLISQIQAMPGFDGFLTSPSFHTLRSAASAGPVIIINHSFWRCDIIILLHDMPPSLITTPHGFYDRANALLERLLDSRQKYGLDSSQYDQTLAYVLAELYKFIGKPVIDRLRKLNIPELSRIWWCPTSVFCSLPLHAMGPIPSDDGEMRYFLDIYICSYTSSLSALIQSRYRDSGSQSSDRPSLLLVAQPDPSLPTVGGEIQVVQALDTEVASLISTAAIPSTIIDGFHHHRFVHFACHGTLAAGKPFDAGFELHGDERLTLLEIVRSHLPAAELAFLSACHTAEMTEGSIMDEVLHLAAAIQYCGFRSVVGTMWAMVDEDGRDLAENFYKALFSNSRKDQGIPYHERSAKALRFAVKRLRRKRRIALERWVNFVHYGA